MERSIGIYFSCLFLGVLSIIFFADPELSEKTICLLYNAIYIIHKRCQTVQDGFGNFRNRAAPLVAKHIQDVPTHLLVVVIDPSPYSEK